MNTDTMEFEENEYQRKKLKKKVDFILEPLLIDILIKKPKDCVEFMIGWLDKRQESLREQIKSRETEKRQ